MPARRKQQMTKQELAEILGHQTGVPAALISIEGTGLNWTAAVIGSLGNALRQDRLATAANALAAQFDLKEE